MLLSVVCSTCYRVLSAHANRDETPHRKLPCSHERLVSRSERHRPAPRSLSCGGFIKCRASVAFASVRALLPRAQPRRIANILPTACTIANPQWLSKSAKKRILLMSEPAMDKRNHHADT